MRNFFIFLFIFTVYTPKAAQAGESKLEKLQIPEHMATTPAKELHHYVARRWKAMKGKLASIDKKKTQLIFLGDSITDAWNRNKTAFTRYYGKYNPQNFAIGADTTHGVLRRIKEGNLKGFSPKLVVMLIGVNNIAWGPRHTVQQTAEGVLKVAQTIRKELPTSKVLIVGLLPRGPRSRDKSFRWLHRYQVNSIVEKYADNKNVFYTDIGEHLLKEDGVPIDGAYSDGVHLSSKGLELWAAAMDSKVKELMGEVKTTAKLKCKVSMSVSKGNEGSAVIELVPHREIPQGSTVSIYFPSGFQLNRSSSKCSISGKFTALSPRASLVLSSKVKKKKTLKFSISNVKNPGYEIKTADLMIEVRDSKGDLTHRGSSSGIEIK